MAYNGYLIQAYNSTSGGYDTLSTAYMFRESYSITPNRRQDLDSYRNANGVLVRTVLDHTATTITFQTVPMWNSTLAVFMTFLSDHYTSTLEKKIKLRYYCPDTNSYSTGDFYVPDIEFPIHYVDNDNNRVQYPSITFEFIEY